MYKFFRSLLFQLDPETAHHLTLQLMWLGGLQPFSALLQMVYFAPSKPVEAFGLTFKNPVGLAAGYDKDGIAVRGLSTLGFGYIEIGTITPRPQPGNPKPRIFRLVEDEAIINRMGFPSRGAEKVMRTLRRMEKAKTRRPNALLGINIGKNKETPNEEAVFDYLELLDNFAPFADYLAINVSSPNTMGLRQLQGRDALHGLLTQLDHQRKLEETRLEKNIPLLVKLAPDLTNDELDNALGVILDTGMDGVIATNTTIARVGLWSRYREETGGLSGSPLKVQSEAMLEKIVRQVAGRIPVVSAGGIMNPEDAKRRLDRGATLIQVYTGLVYSGPGLVRAIINDV
ncbi:MAG: quinone-dependent dihydroorotate dehydrogenase [Anaerolineales bacterium]|jgi:dihydroorotate dehydrogenase